MPMNHGYLNNLINGGIGVSASMFSVITTFQDQLEWWVRMSGSILGIIVALVTLFNLLRNNKNR